MQKTRLSLGFSIFFAAYPYFLKKKLQSLFFSVILKGTKMCITEEFNITTPSFLLSLNAVAHSRVPRNDIIWIEHENIHFYSNTRG